MSMVSPEGPVYQAGTLSGNPLAMTAGIETLRILSTKGTYKKLESLSAMLERGLKDAAKKSRCCHKVLQGRHNVLHIFYK